MASGALDDRAHCFMQALMARGAVEEPAARELYRKIYKRPDDGGFDELWEAINKELSFLHLEMRRVNYVPAPGKAAVRFVGIVNRLGDEHAKLATRFTPAQLALFRSVVEAIAGDSAKADAGLSAVDALNLTIAAQAAPPAAAAEGDAGAGPASGAGPSVVKLGAKEREAALDALAEQGWVVLDGAAGRYRLGPRAFLELGGYLLEAAADDVRELWASRV